METHRVRIFKARNGAKTAEVDGRAYHSPYNPQREADAFFSRYPIEKSDLIVLLGWGLGYAAGSILPRLQPHSRVIVFEPGHHLFVESHRIQDPRFEFVVGERISQFLDDWTLNGVTETARIAWIAWPQAVDCYREQADIVKRAYDRCLRDSAANLLTHIENGPLYFQNALRNLEFASDPDVLGLGGLLAGRPLVSVAAGPSLDYNMRQLASYENRAFILAVDTALRPLLEAGIRPHAVITADPSELNSRHLIDAVPAECVLIAEQGVQPAAMRSAARRFQFSVGMFPDSLLEEHGLGHLRLDVWGSVATAALDFARLTAADPVIFVGQDFSFPGGRRYARDTIFGAVPPPPRGRGTVRSTDIWGAPIETTPDLVAYRDFFVRRMLSATGVRFVNATEGGILNRGVELMPLDAALHRFGQPGDYAALIASRWTPRRVTVDLVSHLERVLELADPSCRCLSDFLELVAKGETLRQDDAGVQSRIAWGLDQIGEIRGRGYAGTIPENGTRAVLEGGAVRN